MILPPRGSSHFLFPVTTFSGGGRSGGGGGLDQKYHFGAGGCPTATVLHGGQNRQSRASRRCDILKCLQPAAGNRIHIQGHSRGAADVLKCGRTLVLAQATLTSNGILPAAISRITSDQEQEKKRKKKLKGCHSSCANCNSLKSGSGGSGFFFVYLSSIIW